MKIKNGKLKFHLAIVVGESGEVRCDADADPATALGEALDLMQDSGHHHHWIIEMEVPVPKLEINGRLELPDPIEGVELELNLKKGPSK